MRKTFWGIASVALLLCFTFAPRASANAVTGTLTLSDCGGGQSGCPAATYTFTITNTSATLTINITGAVNTTNDLITAVNLGTNGISLTGLSVSGPNSGWTASMGSVSNSGCGTNNGSFMCGQGSVTIMQGGSYTWTWSYNALTNSQIDGLLGSGIHIGANYDPHSGFIVSQDATATGVTPEPSTLLLLGSGLLGLGFVARRFNL